MVPSWLRRQPTILSTARNAISGSTPGRISRKESLPGNFAFGKGHRQPRFQKSPTGVADFVNLSVRLGFSNTNNGNFQVSADENVPHLSQAIKSFLRRFCQDRIYKYVDMKAAVQAISYNVESFLQTTRPMHTEEPRLIKSRSQLRMGDRMGLPDEASFDDDRTSLLMQYVYRNGEISTPAKRYVLSFTILRDQFRCFFGTDEGCSLPQASGWRTNMADQLSLHTSGSDLSFTHSPNSSISTDCLDSTFWDACERLSGKIPLSWEDQLEVPSAARTRVG